MCQARDGRFEVVRPTPPLSPPWLTLWPACMQVETRIACPLSPPWLTLWPACMQVETRIACPLSRMQTYWYKALLSRDGNILAQLDKAAAGPDGEEEVGAARQGRGRPLGCA